MRGYRATSGHSLLSYYLRVSGLLNGAWYAVFYLCLPLLIARTGLGASGGPAGLGAYGLILSAYGCGNLAATVVLGGRTLPARPQFLMLGGNVLWRLRHPAAGGGEPAAGRMAVAGLRGRRRGRRHGWADAGYSDRRAAPDPARTGGPGGGDACLHGDGGFGILVAMLLMPDGHQRFGITRVIAACGASI